MGAYDNFQDMYDGGGAGKTGDKFEGGGLISMLANMFGSPYGVGQEEAPASVSTSGQRQAPPPIVQDPADAFRGYADNVPPLMALPQSPYPDPRDPRNGLMTQGTPAMGGPSPYPDPRDPRNGLMAQGTPANGRLRMSQNPDAVPAEYPPMPQQMVDLGFTIDDWHAAVDAQMKNSIPQM